MKILYYLVHPDLLNSHANASIFSQLDSHPELTLVNLYDTYPDFNINGPAEQALLQSHDIVLFQHPLHWYGVPALLKQWMDTVLESGYAYGDNGTALKGKYWGHIITTGGGQAAYEADGYNRYTMTELCSPLEATAHMCQCKWIEPLIFYHARHQNSEQLSAFCQQINDLLSDLLSETSPRLNQPDLTSV